MTQWFQPRRIEGGPNKGKWHYTCSNTSGSYCYPVGGCGDGCEGHATADGATLHYAESAAASEIRERESENSQKRCVECGAWTQHRAMLWGDHGSHAEDIAVCATHDIRANLRKKVLARYGFDDTGAPLPKG